MAYISHRPQIQAPTDDDKMLIALPKRVDQS